MWQKMLEMLCTELMYKDNKNLLTFQSVQGLVESRSDVTKDKFLLRGLKTYGKIFFGYSIKKNYQLPLSKNKA
jgi:hypothetical protein